MKRFFAALFVALLIPAQLIAQAAVAPGVGAPLYPNSGGGGAITSIFGRTGTVTAQSGDYTASQVGAAAVAASANTVYVPNGTSAGQVDYSGATDSTAHINALIAAASQSTTFVIPTTTVKMNAVINKSGIILKGPGLSQFAGGITAYWQPWDVTKPVVQIGDDSGVISGSGVMDTVLYTPSGTGQKGLVFAGGAQKCVATNVYSLGFTKSCIEFRNDDVNPCTFNMAVNVAASTNVVGAYGIAFIDPHATGGTAWTTACQVANFSTTAPNGYPVYMEGAQTNSLTNGYVQTSYSGQGIYVKKTAAELYTPRINFSSVDVDNVSGYGNASIIFDESAASDYRSTSNVANLTPIEGQINSAAGAFWAAGHTTVNATFAPGATTVTLASVAGITSGREVIIAGAGTSGRNYTDYIVSVSGSVATLKNHNSATSVSTGTDVMWGDFAQTIDTAGVLTSWMNQPIVIGSSGRIGFTGSGAGRIWQSNADGNYYADFKDKPWTIYGNISSPTVSAISRAGTTVTVTTSSAHNLPVGAHFTLSGIVDFDGFNTSQSFDGVVATVPSSTTFTYTSPVSGSNTPANQAPTLVPYLGLGFNRGALWAPGGNKSGYWLEAASGTYKPVLFQDNTLATTYLWTPDTTSGTFDIRVGSSVGGTTTLGLRYGTNSVGDYFTVQGNGVFWQKKAVKPSNNSGGAQTYVDANGLLHVLDANNFDTLLSMEKTINGSTGAVTINQSLGEVQFAAAASTLVVTDSLVDTNSVIVATVQGTDATMTSVRVTKASGSFTLTANAAATATTKVDFVVFN